MAAKKSLKGLGKGLDSLIPKDVIKQAPEKEESVTKAAEVNVSITKIEPNRDQPRKMFNEEKLQELSESIKQHGVISPLIVQDKGDHYEIIAGERRWRASRMAGLKEVPVVIRDLTDQEIEEVALIENIQREDLNPIEEAQAYKRLITKNNMTQEQLSERLAKSRTAIANTMRLLNLPEEIQQMLIDDQLSQGHARALLSIEDKEKQINIANKVINDKLSVRDVEKLVRDIDKPAKVKKITPEVLRILYDDLEKRMREVLSAKVNITAKDEEKGKIEIEYYSRNELEKLVDALCNAANGE